MKKALLGSAVVFAMWGGAAFANEEMKQSDSLTQDCVRDAAGMLVCPEQDAALGGAGEEGMGQDVGAESDLGTTDDLGTGGSDQNATGTDQGATGSDIGAPTDMGTTGDMSTGATEQAPQTTVIIQDQDQTQAAEKKGPDMRGVQVFAGGGVEGYTGDLAPQINPGPSWGVGVAFKPWSAIGLELGYTGAVNGIDAGVQNDDGFSREADVIRNGGSAVATIGLGASPVQPYVLGGIGVDRYNVRDAEGEPFSDDTVGNVPVGVGLRTHIGSFTADLRGNYGVLFNQDFAVNEGNTRVSDVGDETPTGRYGAQLRLGATF